MNSATRLRYTPDAMAPYNEKVILPLPAEKPWADIRIACGFGDHIPLALADLQSNDHMLRIDALWAIDNEVIRQGNRYEGAAYIIKPLVDILHRRSHGRDEAYGLLIEIADGYDMPGATVELVDGSVHPVHDVCRSELNRYRDQFEDDVLDKFVTYEAQELLESLDEM
ncbi:MAG: hypothetical protein KDB27_12735 [Planctomycetales bacterium]|nr:hypothetical protein [Planctomycetales bacterium]